MIANSCKNERFDFVRHLFWWNSFIFGCGGKFGQSCSLASLDNTITQGQASRNTFVTRGLIPTASSNLNNICMDRLHKEEIRHSFGNFDVKIATDRKCILTLWPKKSSSKTKSEVLCPKFVVKILLCGSWRKFTGRFLGLFLVPLTCSCLNARKG